MPGACWDVIGLIAPKAAYEAIRAFVEAHLPSDPALFNEYHALLVAVGREHCGTVPRCDGCPLRFDLRGRARARHGRAFGADGEDEIGETLGGVGDGEGAGSIAHLLETPWIREQRAHGAHQRRRESSEDCGRTTAPPARSTIRAFAVCSSPLVPGKGT